MTVDPDQRLITTLDAIDSLLARTLVHLREAESIHNSLCSLSEFVNSGEKDEYFDQYFPNLGEKND